MLKHIVIAIALLGSQAFAAGEIYRWKDANGTWHYGDRPQQGAEVVGKTAPAGTPAATPAPAPAAPATPASSSSSDETLPVSKEIAQQVRQEAAAAKAKTCEKAKADYDQKVQALRIKRVDAKGNVTFLSEAEIDAARLQARAARDLACAP